MNGTALLVVLIETPNSNRSTPLVRILEHNPKFELIRLQASMFNAHSEIRNSQISLNMDRFEFFNGRVMTPQEIGCSLSHNMARKIIATSRNGGVILEDDARVRSLEDFYQIGTKFLSENCRKPRVLSLNMFRLNPKQNFDKDGYQPLIGKPMLAVSYALSPIAASILVDKNSPITTVSDWPNSRVRYYATFKEVVAHGDSESASTINIDDSPFRIGPNFLKKLSQILFIVYFRDKPKEVNFFSYVHEIHWSKASWYLDSALRHLLKFCSS
jgi:GR25 family glycosyltransferase involved in LPS biosynthesis